MTSEQYEMAKERRRLRYRERKERGWELFANAVYVHTSLRLLKLSLAAGGDVPEDSYLTHYDLRNADRPYLDRRWNGRSFF